jgi:hypothetical protein
MSSSICRASHSKSNIDHVVRTDLNQIPSKSMDIDIYESGGIDVGDDIDIDIDFSRLRLWAVSEEEDFGAFAESNCPDMAQHYVCPPTSLEMLRRRYGERRSLWGDWSPAETRQFYKTQLPKALQSKYIFI